jgi:hypothetical protein
MRVVCFSELQEVAKEAIGEAEKSLKNLQQVRVFVGVNQLGKAVGARSMFDWQAVLHMRRGPHQIGSLHRMSGSDLLLYSNCSDTYHLSQ